MLRSLLAKQAEHQRNAQKGNDHRAWLAARRGSQSLPEPSVPELSLPRFSCSPSAPKQCQRVESGSSLHSLWYNPCLLLLLSDGNFSFRCYWTCALARFYAKYFVWMIIDLRDHLGAGAGSGLTSHCIISISYKWKLRLTEVILCELETKVIPKDCDTGPRILTPHTMFCLRNYSSPRQFRHPLAGLLDSGPVPNILSSVATSGWAFIELDLGLLKYMQT